MRRFSWLFVSLGLVLGAGQAGADVWDVQSDADNGEGTDNDLTPGTNQIHDLGALAGPVADEDWFLMAQDPFSSYEVVVDGTSGDLGLAGFAVDRIQGDGTTVAQNAAPVGVGYTKSLAWANGTTVITEFVRVSGAACGTACGADDVYQIRLRETTLSVPRFNNSGTQLTSLLLQNTSNRTVNGTVYFFNVGGANIGNFAFSLGAFALQNLPTASVVPGDADRTRRTLRLAQWQGRGIGAVDRLHLRHTGGDEALPVGRRPRVSRRPSRPAARRTPRQPTLKARALPGPAP